MTPQEILAATDKMLFPNDGSDISKIYHNLAKIWHPDNNSDPQASTVFAHLSTMYSAAKVRTKPHSQLFTRANGSQFKMEYKRHTWADGCEIFIGESSVAYLIGSTNADLSSKASAHRWRYLNNDMRNEMSRFLLDPYREEMLNDGHMFIYRRTPDQILMKDLIEITQQSIDPLHVSWMVTRMNNIACYLEWAGLSHLCMLPANLLVSLEYHSVALVGPALYLSKFGSRPKAASKTVLSIIPEMASKSFVLDSTVDRRIIRHTALELLGDPSGNRIRNDGRVRPAIANWLNMAPSKTAVEDYAKWEGCLGERKFVVYPKTANELYSAAY